MHSYAMMQPSYRMTLRRRLAWTMELQAGEFVVVVIGSELTTSVRMERSCKTVYLPCGIRNQGVWLRRMLLGWLYPFSYPGDTTS